MELSLCKTSITAGLGVRLIRPGAAASGLRLGQEQKTISARAVLLRFGQTFQGRLRGTGKGTFAGFVVPLSPRYIGMYNNVREG